MTTLSSLCNSLGLSAETALNLLDDFIKEKNLDGNFYLHQKLVIFRRKNLLK